MTDSILYWNQVALDANRESHTQVQGDQTGPPLSARALAIVHLAMYDAFIGADDVSGNTSTDSHYLPAAELPTAKPGASPDAAIAGAAHHALSELFPKQKANFVDTLYGFIKEVTVPGSLTVDNLKDGYDYGEKVAMALLKRRENDPGGEPRQLRAQERVGKMAPRPGQSWANRPCSPLRCVVHALRHQEALHQRCTASGGHGRR